MASTGAPITSQSSTVPQDFANVVPQPVMLDHSFTLQAVMELQKSVSELATKTDRLIKDVEGQGKNIDAVRHQITFVKGAVWIFGGLLSLAGLIFAGLRLIPH